MNTNNSRLISLPPLITPHTRGASPLKTYLKVYACTIIRTTTASGPSPSQSMPRKKPHHRPQGPSQEQFSVRITAKNLRARAYQSMMITTISPIMIDSYGNPGILSQDEDSGLTVKLPVSPSTSTW